MTQIFENNAKTTLSAGINNSTTTIPITAETIGGVFPTPGGTEWYYATLSNIAVTLFEIVKVTARSGNNLTVVRAQEGTTALSWTTSDFIYMGITQATLETFPQGFNNAGDAKGTNAVNLQSGRTGTTRVASGTGTVAVGYDTKASGPYSISVGYGNEATIDYAVSIGTNAVAQTGTYAIAIGAYSSCEGADSIAMGRNSDAQVDRSLSIGRLSKAAFRQTWSTGLAVIAGDVIGSSAGNSAFVCTNSGTTHATTEPTWVTTSIGTSTSDNGVTWVYVGNTASASIFENTAIGYRSKAYDFGAVSIGSQSASGLEGVAVGDIALTGYHGVAVGGNCFAWGEKAIGIGHGVTVDFGGGLYNTAIGANAYIDGSKSYSSAFGGGAYNVIDNSYVMAGVNLIHASGAGDPFVNQSGNESIIVSNIVDLKTTADDVSTITIPTGASFYVDEVGVIVTSSNTVTVQPTVSFGKTGATTDLLAATLTTKAAVKGRDKFAPLHGDGLTTLTASVKIGATATTLSGRFYWKGILIED